MEQKRIALWDNLKFFLILCVVLGHCSERYASDAYKSLFMFVYTFHMPLFIFISGLFHRNTRIAQKICAYLAVFYIYKVAVFLVNAAFGKNPGFKVLEESGAPWFMFALAAFTLLTYLLREVNPYLLLVTGVILACFSGYDPSINSYLVLSRIIVFYPFYLLGTLFSGENMKRLERILENRYLQAAGVVILTVWAAMCLFGLDHVYILRNLFVGRKPYSADLQEWGYLWRLLTYAVTFLVGFSCILITPKKRLPVISVVGQRTLQIYFWHRIILYAFAYWGLPAAICPTRIGKLLWLLIGVGITLITSLKIFSFPAGTIMKFQKKTEKNIENSG